MPSDSNEGRKAVAAKLLPPRNLPIREVAQQEGISRSTVYTWRKEAREQGRCLPNAGDGGTAAWSSTAKFGAVLETAAMNGAELAEYCRRRGVYPEQLAAWRQDCEQSASMSQQERRQETLDAKAKRELQRKNAALAETAALVTLLKKVLRKIPGTIFVHGELALALLHRTVQRRRRGCGTRRRLRNWAVGAATGWRVDELNGWPDRKAASQLANGLTEMSSCREAFSGPTDSASVTAWALK